MTRAIVIEDEAIAARKLTKLLQECDIDVIAQLKSNQEISDYLVQNDEPDLYFMDIHLNDGIVFEFLQGATITAPIIFTTAYDEYAIKAFKQNSIDYLLKPIDKQELEDALEKFKKWHQNQSPIDAQLISQILLNSTKQVVSYRERIKIKIGDHIRSIPIHDISFFYSKEKINFACTIENRSYPIDYTLDKLLSELDPKRFFKVNRSYIVSIQNISDIITYSNSRLKIMMGKFTDHEIIVAREKVSEFKNWLG